jgi:hypothetical protein
MLGNNDRGSVVLGFSLCLTFVLTACSHAASPASGVAGNAGSNPQVPSASGRGTMTAGTTAVAPTTGTGGMSSAPVSTQTGTAGHDIGQPAAGSGSGDVPSGSGGSMASAGAGGQAGSEAPADAGTMPHGDLGKGDGSDVITIGDSWMNVLTNGGGIEAGLDRAGTMYRHYAVAGTTLIGGDIPQQYVRAKGENPKISTVIMTGGGNDIMFSNGCATKESCTMAVQQIADALDQLWSMMADDGVKDTIYIEYSKNAGTAPSDTRPDTAPIPKICTSGRITCHSIDTTPMVGPNDTVDGIHPTLAACDLIAKAVLDLMQSAGIRR